MDGGDDPPKPKSSISSDAVSERHSFEEWSISLFTFQSE